MQSAWWRRVVNKMLRNTLCRLGWHVLSRPAGGAPGRAQRLGTLWCPSCSRVVQGGRS